MRTIVSFLAIVSFLGGCRNQTVVKTPQEQLQYHADQPEQGSAQAVEEALAKGADTKLALEDGLVPWLAAAGGVDESRVYAGDAKKPEDLDLAGGSNNPAASGSAAYQEYSIAVLNALLRAGVDVNVRDAVGENALHKAVLQGRTQVVDFLISKGVEIDVQDDAGYTPLMRAVVVGKLPTVQLLLEKGASTAPMSKFGQNATQLAQESGNQELIQAIDAANSK
ncbi:MAG: ankyrin repeat domain-containing protein [Fibrobacteria bacterium]|nr:ankyrin repeat domain-containing protein [Fibrobacteria bacterium]